MKVAVSVPQDVFDQGEQLVEATGRSRSDVYSAALREYVARHAADSITETLDRVVAQVAHDGTDFTSVAAKHLLAHSEW